MGGGGDKSLGGGGGLAHHYHHHHSPPPPLPFRHRRILNDDSRGVQEPLNETMCGCNDINAAPGKMGANGHLGDGGCLCEGLTMRGRHFLMIDTLKNVNDQR